MKWVVPLGARLARVESIVLVAVFGCGPGVLERTHSETDRVLVLLSTAGRVTLEGPTKAVAFSGSDDSEALVVTLHAGDFLDSEGEPIDLDAIRARFSTEASPSGSCGFCTQFGSIPLVSRPGDACPIPSAIRDAELGDVPALADLARRVILDFPGTCQVPNDVPLPPSLRELDGTRPFPTTSIALAGPNGETFIAGFGFMGWIDAGGGVTLLHRSLWNPLVATYLGDRVLVATFVEGEASYELVTRSEQTSLAADSVLLDFKRVPRSLHATRSGEVLVGGGPVEGRGAFVALCAISEARLSCSRRVTPAEFAPLRGAREAEAVERPNGDFFLVVEDEPTAFYLWREGEPLLSPIPVVGDLLGGAFSQVEPRVVLVAGDQVGVLLRGAAPGWIAVVGSGESPTLRALWNVPGPWGGYAIGDTLHFFSYQTETIFRGGAAVSEQPIGLVGLSTYPRVTLSNPLVVMDDSGAVFRASEPGGPFVRSYGLPPPMGPEAVAAVVVDSAGADLLYNPPALGRFDRVSESVQFVASLAAPAQVTGMAKLDDGLVVSGVTYGGGELAGWVGWVESDTGRTHEIQVESDLRGLRLVDVASDGRRFVAVGDAWRILLGDRIRAKELMIEWDDPSTPETDAPIENGGCIDRGRVYSDGLPERATFRAVGAKDGVAYAVGCEAVIVRIDLVNGVAQRIEPAQAITRPFGLADLDRASFLAVRMFSASDAVMIVPEIFSAPPAHFVRIRAAGTDRADGLDFEQIDLVRRLDSAAQVYPLEVLGTSAAAVAGLYQDSGSNRAIRGLTQAESSGLFHVSSEVFSAGGFGENGELVVGSLFGRLFIGER
ncbi:MAG: hypothetical protein HY791_20455 [Deltaproteobacteria bacterium]|nr:hypothetical protein [Deltaproteobacteria bacterium]